MDGLRMFYKIAEGPVQITRYGLTLAQNVPLPPPVLNRAKEVARTLEETNQQQRNNSTALAQQKKRKLVLGLKEQLVLARNGAMRGDALKTWLKRLQEEFVERMDAIDCVDTNDSIP